MPKYLFFGELQVLLAVYFICQVSGQSLEYCKYESKRRIVSCVDENLAELPDLSKIHPTEYYLAGNRFPIIRQNDFPVEGVEVLSIARNDPPVLVTDDAFYWQNHSLRVLSVQNLEFDFNHQFTPVDNLMALKELTLGNNRYTSPIHIQNEIISPVIRQNLTKYVIVESGIMNISPPALKIPVRRMEHLGFPKNLLTSIPYAVKSVMVYNAARYFETKSFTLDLSYNLFTTLRQKNFPDGCSATVFNFSYNQIQCLEQRALDNCQNLKTLDLRGNKLLKFLNPSLLTCKVPTTVVLIQDTSVESLSFTNNRCVKGSVFWNTSVPCDCELRAVSACMGDSIEGHCFYRGKARQRPVDIKEMTRLWKIEGCLLHHTHNPTEEMNGCGSAELPWQAWLACPAATNVSLDAFIARLSSTGSLQKRHGLTYTVSVFLLAVHIY